ncbi:MAG: DALR anticodon-binding domain-containing protein [Comamonadaceae bacterium]|nr:DALR anticodon-binding domain-containing protein [Comamonadaceae bacterium]
MLTRAAAELAPHDVAFYLRDLAAAFHSLLRRRALPGRRRRRWRARAWRCWRPRAQVLRNALAVLRRRRRRECRWRARRRRAWRTAA